MLRLPVMFSHQLEEEFTSKIFRSKMVNYALAVFGIIYLSVVPTIEQLYKAPLVCMAAIHYRLAYIHPHRSISFALWLFRRNSFCNFAIHRSDILEFCARICGFDQWGILCKHPMAPNLPSDHLLNKNRE